MNMKKEDRVSRAMSSLDDMQRATAPKGTFARIQQNLADQRMTAPTPVKQSNEWVRVAAVIALVVSSNIWAVSSYMTDNKMTADTSESSSYPQLMTDFNLYEDE